MKSLLAILALVVGVNAHAAAAPNEISVTGKGTVTAAADQANLEFAITTKDAKMEVAARDNATARAELENAVAALGYKKTDVKTTGLNADSTEEQIGRTQQTRDVQVVTHSLSLKVTDLKTLGRTVDALWSVKGVKVHRIGFDTSRRSELERQARRLAVRDARAQADEVAQEMGREIAHASEASVSYSGGGIRMESARAMKAMADVGTNIEAGDVDITGSVTVVFSLK